MFRDWASDAVKQAGHLADGAGSPPAESAEGLRELLHGTDTTRALGLQLHRYAGKAVPDLRSERLSAPRALIRRADPGRVWEH